MLSVLRVHLGQGRAQSQTIPAGTQNKYKGPMQKQRGIMDIMDFFMDIFKDIMDFFFMDILMDIMDCCHVDISPLFQLLLSEV